MINKEQQQRQSISLLYFKQMSIDGVETLNSSAGNICTIVILCICTTSPPRALCDTRSIFKQNRTNFGSETPFSRLVALDEMASCLLLRNETRVFLRTRQEYLKERQVNFFIINFPKILVIISYKISRCSIRVHDHTHTHTHTHTHIYIYIYIYIYINRT